jgi:hypothetical protein
LLQASQCRQLAEIDGVKSCQLSPGDSESSDL